MSGTKTRLVSPCTARKIHSNMAASGGSGDAVKLTKEDIPGASLEGRLRSQHKIEKRNFGSMSWRLLQRTQNKSRILKKVTWNLRRPRCWKQLLVSLYDNFEVMKVINCLNNEILSLKTVGWKNTFKVAATRMSSTQIKIKFMKGYVD